MKKYKFLEHTADAFFEAFGESFEELLENSAEAMCSVVYAIEKVEPKIAARVEASGGNKEELLHNFLEEVVVEMEMRGMVFREFKVKEFDEGKNLVIAELTGEKMNAEKHGLKTEVKAVTWHKFFVKREGSKWIARVLVDI